MNTIKINVSSRTLWIDLLILGAIVMVPGISHLLGFSLQAIEPMRIALFAGMLLVNDRRNAYLLALLIPLFSTIATGFPMGGKCALMAVELICNVAVFEFAKSRLSVFQSMLLAIVLSKMLYYGLKFLVVGAVATTVGISTQIIVVLCLSVVFSCIKKTV